MKIIRRRLEIMPLHPLVVHFPIALLLTATLIEIVNLFLKKESVSRMGTVLVFVGVLLGFVSLATGDPAEAFAFKNWGRGIHDTVELHSFLAGTSVTLFAIVAVIKLFGKRLKFNKNLIIALVIVFSITGSTTLAITGHLGGKIVYQHEQLTSKSGGTVDDD
ncbi:DUF2231 domain-containing protein [Bacillus sp. 1NLA3E]|uniref:DUF2231 domain-containing protein n=1 Tax=Bacillus sp. 1NLA3E TaxID=666686 RepID=UPI00032801ED|nr:DUF2231 domain-containing protein [Bacillus sp. 1NLA3E]AGK52290.1 hypothetical protein B1NLA3E_02530 [Bacillus sp. 1NLA3E]